MGSLRSVLVSFVVGTPSTGSERSQFEDRSADKPRVQVPVMRRRLTPECVAHANWGPELSDQCLQQYLVRLDRRLPSAVSTFLACSYNLKFSLPRRGTAQNQTNRFPFLGYRRSAKASLHAANPNSFLSHNNGIIKIKCAGKTVISVTVDVEARCRVALKAESWSRIEDIRDMIKRKLKNECNISHSTLEFEHEDRAHKNASLYGHRSGWVPETGKG